MMAERGGFEPPIPLRVCHLSKVVPSTTRTPLQAEKVGVVYYSARLASIANTAKHIKRGATGDLCKDAVHCLHLRIVHILAYMYLRYARPRNLRLPRGSAAGATNRRNGLKVSFCSCIAL